ncbi:GDSL esterase/lipase 1 isoform X2 [Ziziphus jujuba]|uniref:GDSL esterase/lipase 1 isoform X2 n=1 Tax=Ziziphus jujuba TaxID=326968 RepID=A0A6P4B105_ZIZJJ|nr:GDSL esterase/lipase 1 isoform X2 [Ziziphus jujuba]
MVLAKTSSKTLLSFGEKNPTSLFIFGDSLYDAGNNNYFLTPLRVNHWPYGETYFHFPTGRTSNGRLIPDFIAEYAKLPLIPPCLQPGISYNYGVNFASLGAGALQETNKGSVISLNIQLSYFKNVEKNLRHKLGGEEAKRFLSKAVYIFSIGTNDYNSKTTPIPFHSQEEYVGMVIGNLTNVIKGIYNKGGRKFGILNLVAKGCFPVARALRSAGSEGSCMDEFSTARKLHNTALSKVLVELERQLKGFKYSETDFYTAFSERINNPSKYGFKEAKTACCGSGPYRGLGGCGGNNKYELCDTPDDYLFFDPAHPSEKANEQFAKLMWSGNSPLIWPYNLKTLFELQTQ